MDASTGSAAVPLVVTYSLSSKVWRRKSRGVSSRAPSQLSGDLGLAYTEAHTGEPIEGTLPASCLSPPAKPPSSNAVETSPSSPGVLFLTTTSANKSPASCATMAASRGRLAGKGGWGWSEKRQLCRFTHYLLGKKNIFAPMCA